ncbi:alpha-galactosidase [Candidatus Bathyarchaeota archaeon]|nr:alpha-galactosidase [Candidatus Bathyarchaeota archaeon]
MSDQSSQEGTNQTVLGEPSLKSHGTCGPRTMDLQLAWNDLDDLPDREVVNMGLDWLIHDGGQWEAGAFKGKLKGEMVLDNGLIRRHFSLYPDGATIEYQNVTRGESLIRSIRPEAMISVNGTCYTIGGLRGLQEHGYLLRKWIPYLTADPGAFHLYGFSTNSIKERLKWKKVRHHAPGLAWPPRGIELVFNYNRDSIPGLDIEVHYELHDDIPLLSKWLVINNNGSGPFIIDSFTSEILAIVESTSVPQGDATIARVPRMIHVESDYIFSAMSPEVGNVTTCWDVDPLYTSQVAYHGDSKVLLESKPPIGPGRELQPGDSFHTFRTYELVHDDWDRQRRALAKCRMYRMIAPWVTENPVFMHVTTADPANVRQVIDQCAAVGFEMVILSFGSGLNMEWAGEPEYIEEYKELFDYAHSKGIEIGGYSLFSSRSVGPVDDVIPPAGERPTFGSAPCLCSSWGIRYLGLVRKFLQETGCDFLEHDGPYPGDTCISSDHPGHSGLHDSQWNQWQAQAGLYRWCRERGIYVNQPDWYFLSGGSKTGMGYKEVNWSLPRERQVLLARQNIHDGTWEKLPTMGWMLTPLSVYHRVGNWKASTLEPLSEHVEWYEAHLAQNFLSGVQSCYRGKRLFDSPTVKKVVEKWVQLYKHHRDILDSEIIHLRRPDGRNLDCILHVNSRLEEKAFLAVFNPTSARATSTIEIPLYYAGLSGNVCIVNEKGECMVRELDEARRLWLEIAIEAKDRTWYVFKQA